MKKIEDYINDLKRLGEHLVSYNFPEGDPDSETVLNNLKHMDVTADGYQVTIHYSKAKYLDYYVLSFQIMGRTTPFLPFNVVCKLARKCLGNDDLSLIEIYKDRRKIYCWTLMTDLEGQPVEYPLDDGEYEPLAYEGLEYNLMRPSQIRFY